LKVLEKNPTLGPQVRSIYIDAEQSLPTDAVSSILSRTTGLVRLYSNRIRLKHGWIPPNFKDEISWHTFKMMVKTSGATLRELSMRTTPDREQSPAIFNHLRELKFLEWKGKTIFKTKDETDIRDALPKLTELRVDTHDPSFLTTLARMK
jgi:hypothetical protein